LVRVVCVLAPLTFTACTSSEATGPETTRPSPDVSTSVPATVATTSTTSTSTTSTTSTTTTTSSPPPTTTPTPTTVALRPRAVSGVSKGVSDSVLRLHLGLLRRTPSSAELRAGVERYRETGSFEWLTATVLDSEEYRARHESDPPDDTFVHSLYADVLGREPDPEGAASWEANLAGGMSRAAVAAAFIQSPESVLRTGTAAPEPPPPPRGGSRPPAVAAPSGGVLALGDSVMLGAAGALGAVIGGVEVDAAVSRQFTTGLELLLARRDESRLPGTVVVHLGTNGSVAGETCDALMDVLAGRRVVLVTLHVPRSWETANNAILRDCALRHGAGIADWSAVADRPGHLAGDGYHIDPDGADAYARLIASVL
jgi:hypothetical protein